MSDQTNPNLVLEKYRVPIVGGGVEVLDRFQVRDRIRKGDIIERTELSPPGTEDWKPASEYPELARYFQMKAQAKVVHHEIWEKKP